MTRIDDLRLGMIIGETKYKIPKSEYTAMYLATIYNDYDGKGDPVLSSGIEERGNYCSVCLFLEDAPYNFGEVIEPSSYDADCDECGKMALPYAHENDEAVPMPTVETTNEFMSRVAAMFGLVREEE